MQVHPLVIFWVVIAFICLTVSIWNCLDSWADQYALKAVDPGKRPTDYDTLLTLADHNFRSALEHTWVQLVFLAAGVRSIAVPSPTLTYGDPGAVFVVLGFVSAELALIVHTLAEAAIRRRTLIK